MRNFFIFCLKSIEKQVKNGYNVLEKRHKGRGSMPKNKKIAKIEIISSEQIIKMQENILKNYQKADKSKPLSVLFEICKGFYGKLIVSAIFCVLQLSVMLVMPIVTANTIDAITIGGENAMTEILINLGIAVFLLLINYPMQRLYMKSRNDVTRSIELGLRGAIVTKLQSLTIQFNKENAAGKIHSKITNDVNSVSSLIMALHTNLIHIVINVGTIISVIVAKGNFSVLLFFVGCAPIMLLISKHFKKDIREKNREYRKNNEVMNSKVVDMVNLIPVTKAHSLEDFEIERMTGLLGDNAKAGYRIDDINGRFHVSSWLLMQAFRLLCLIFTVIMALNGRLTVGDITLYQTYFTTFLNYISQILNLVPTITKGTEAIRSMGEVLDSPDVEENSGKKEIENIRGEFQFDNTVFEYRDGSKRVLDGLNLHINAGETVAFVGESGAGKSTMINLITGFYMCDSGSITVDGIDMKELNLKSYRENIAVVPQSSILFSGSMRDNITYGIKEVSDEKIAEILELSCLTDVVADLPEGIDTLIGERGTKLSGGQQQRVAIARALIRNPKIIIFDEATSALDTVSEKHIQRAIENLSSDKTTFIVAHRLSTVKNADKIAVIKDGKCVEFGSYDELMALQGEFYNFTNLQV